MGNVTLPTPVFVAGLSLAALGGYLAGAVLSPSAPERATATVSSYEAKTSHLCLSGDSVAKLPGLNDAGELCGTWSHGPGVRTPKPGDRFRFVTLDAGDGGAAGKPLVSLVIFGTVVE